MTVSDPGAGQQQGREVIDVLARVVSSANTGAINGNDGFVESYNVMPGPIHAAIPLLARHGVVVGQDGLVHHAPSPTPPARDSGRDEARERDTQLDTSVPLDEAREALARLATLLELRYADGFRKNRERWLWESDANDLLHGLSDSLPELDKLLRRPA